MSETSEYNDKQRIAFNGALARAQGQMETLLKGRFNPHFKSRYADLASVWNVCREPFAAEGISILQLPIEPSGIGLVTLKTIISHKDGYTEESTFSLPVSKAGDPQAVGSALTYAKRYVLLGIAGVAPEDDDGSTAAGKAPSVQVTDYSGTVAEARVELAKCKTGPEARQLYSLVRGSAIGEPDKTALLTEMKETILKKWPDKS